MKPFALLPSVALWLAWAAPGYAESWTNAAGQAISARFETLQKGRVTLRTDTGRAVILPLTSLSKSDQQRLRTLADQELLPSETADLAAQTRQDLERLALFEADGKVTAAQASQRRQALRQRFERSLALLAQQRGQPLSPSATSRCVVRWLGPP